MKRRLFLALISVLSMSCSKEMENEGTSALKEVVLTELHLIKPLDEDNGKLTVNKPIINKVDHLISCIHSIDGSKNEALDSVNIQLKAIIKTSHLSDSLKNELIKHMALENQTKSAVLINALSAVHHLKSQYYDNLFWFDKLQPQAVEINTDSGKYYEVTLEVAKSKIRPNLYLGDPDTIHFQTWYGYKMSDYAGDHFKAYIRVPENANNIESGLYQIPTSKGNVLIEFEINH